MDWNSSIFKRGYFIEFIAVLKFNLCLLFGLTFLLFITQNAQAFSRLVFIYFFLFNTTLTYLGHILLKKYLEIFYRKSSASSKCLIITTSTLIEDVLAKMKSSTEWAHQISSIILMDVDRMGEAYDGIPVVANRVNLYEIAPSLLMDEVFIHLPDYTNKQMEKIINGFEYAGIPVHVNVDFFDILTAYKTTEEFAGFTVLSYVTNIFDYRRMIIKRLLDICGAIIGLLVTAIITPFVALAIRIESPGPIFFKQIRIGKNGREFYIYKFRSMYQDAEARKAALMKQNEMEGLMFKMTDDPRVTKVGNFIRKTSIDELPQFWNILIGDMSLVGTRPPTKDEFTQYNMYYRRRLSIKPGLTGMWQVSGRSDISDFEDVVQLDLQYIDNWSLTLDIKILLQTVFVVLFRKGSK
jgi:exopolysaccharide biosynthesis polyprenyl glycosylphosphotransferase